MKLLHGSVRQFGSYEELDLDFTAPGLTLVYGPTGSGKSTVLDIAFWVLYGQTAKNGNVDEVRSWQAGDEPTIGCLAVDTGAGTIIVNRSRGAVNDLFWSEEGQEGSKRGKDLKETQQMLEDRLGVSAELFSMSAYFHEFSPTASFFTAKAKDRREVFESIANLDMPVRLADKASSERKKAKAKTADAALALAKAYGRVEKAEQDLVSVEEYRADWEAQHRGRLAKLSSTALEFDNLKDAQLEAARLRYDRWNADYARRLYKAKIKRASQSDQVVPEKFFEDNEKKLRAELKAAESVKCEACGGPHPDVQEAAARARAGLDELIERKEKNFWARAAADNAAQEVERIEAEVNPHEAELISIAAERNNYAQLLEEEKNRENPFDGQFVKAKNVLHSSKASADTIAQEHALAAARGTQLSQLYDLSFQLRGLILAKSVKEIEDRTNSYLERFFDSEIRVQFSLEGSDSLEVYIQKSGYDCVYRQLSKGQQRLLKLCFGVSVMGSAANSSGVHFDNLFFDESLDGLDTSLKLKAFNLFQDLQRAHSSVYVIDHAPELQELFDQRVRVELIGDRSVVERENG